MNCQKEDTMKYKLTLTVEYDDAEDLPTLFDEVVDAILDGNDSDRITRSCTYDARFTVDAGK